MIRLNITIIQPLFLAGGAPSSVVLCYVCRLGEFLPIMLPLWTNIGLFNFFPALSANLSPPFL